jgi:2'-5' RNA ligase
MPRPNWFLAWPIDAALLEACVPPAGFRKVHPLDAHITLAFLGGCGEAAALAALGAVDSLLEREPKCALGISLGTVVPMGPKTKYSALSALLVDGRAEIESWIGRWRDAPCSAAAVRTDRRPPKAHATLARPRYRATEEQRALGLDWAAALDLSHVHIVLDRIALYTWHEPRGARQFRIVEQRNLLPCR